MDMCVGVPVNFCRNFFYAVLDIYVNFCRSVLECSIYLICWCVHKTVCLLQGNTSMPDTREADESVRCLSVRSRGQRWNLRVCLSKLLLKAFHVVLMLEFLHPHVRVPMIMKLFPPPSHLLLKCVGKA